MNNKSDEHIQIEAKLIEQEHRFIRIVLNFFTRKQYAETDPRRRATGIALIYSFFSPGTAAATGIGLVSAFSLYVAWQANSKIDEQNLLMSRQNELLQVQNKLSDAQRRASMNIELSAILERITDIAEGHEKKNKSEEKVKLSQALEARILSVLRGFKPYFSLDYSKKKNKSKIINAKHTYSKGDAILTPLLSPERGQLLLALIEANVDMTDLNEKGADFSYADLKGVLLSDVFLEEIALTEADLSDGMFGDSKISNAIIHRTNFSSSYLHGVEFVGTRCNECLFDDSDLRTADLTLAEFFDVSFVAAKMNDVKANGAYLINSKFKNANLTGADLRKAHLKGSDLSLVKWNDADICGADLSNSIYDMNQIKKAFRWEEAIIVLDEKSITYLSGKTISNATKSMSIDKLTSCPDRKKLI